MRAYGADLAFMSGTYGGTPPGRGSALGPTPYNAPVHPWAKGPSRDGPWGLTGTVDGKR